jgi:hypothetical protein
MKRMGTLLASAMLISGCGGNTPAENVAAAENAAAALPAGNAMPPPDYDTVPPSETALPTDAWVGKWIGVEGLVLDIQPGSEAGKYRLDVTLLDGTETYEGTGEGDRISFTRNGVAETIRPATGDETGLKYLAGKQNCLMIKQAEGFCRD